MFDLISTETARQSQTPRRHRACHILAIISVKDGTIETVSINLIEQVTSNLFGGLVTSLSAMLTPHIRTMLTILNSQIKAKINGKTLVK